MPKRYFTEIRNRFFRAPAEHFGSEAEAAAAWSDKYRAPGVKKEYAAIVYAARIGGNVRYYTGRTYSGMGELGFIRANAVIPFLILYLFESLAQRLKRRAGIAAYLHTHPKPPPGYTSRFHSAADLFLLKLPGIKAVYVIPYENGEMNRAGKRTGVSTDM